MDIKLERNDAGSVVGWDIVATTKKEHDTLSQIRALQFFGEGDRAVVYDGMKLSDKYPDCPHSISYRTLGRLKELEKKESDRLSLEQQQAQAVQKMREMGFVQTGDNQFSLQDLGDFLVLVTPKIKRGRPVIERILEGVSEH